MSKFRFLDERYCNIFIRVFNIALVHIPFRDELELTHHLISACNS